MKMFCICFLVVLLILSFFAPFIVSQAFELGIHAPLVTTIISPDAMIGYIGTVISGVASVFVAVIALRISNVANKLNKQVLEQNEAFCSDNTEKAVQPHISLHVIPAHQTYKLPILGLLGKNDDADEEYGVKHVEQNPYEYSALIQQDSGIRFFLGIHEMVKKYKETPYEARETKFGNGFQVSFYRKKDVYVHLILNNIGCGPALATMIQMRKNVEDCAAMTLPLFDLRVSDDTIHIHLYFAKEISDNEEYELSITYQNLYGMKYRQVFPFTKLSIMQCVERETINEKVLDYIKESGY